MEKQDKIYSIRQTFHNSPDILFVNYLLLKLGGQVTLSYADLARLTHDYVSYEAAVCSEDQTVTLTLRTRPEEYPRPEITTDRTRS